MAQLGRPKLARTDVERRSWWEKIERTRKEMLPTQQSAQDDHWYWRGEPGAKLYPAWKTKGERPERVLFYHLRPEEWDGRGERSRMKRLCGDEECINPWHAEFTKPPSLAGDLDTFRELYTLEEAMRDEETAYSVWFVYTRMLDRVDDYTNIIIPTTGQVMPVKYGKFSSPAAIVAFEKLMELDPLPTMREAVEEYQRLQEARTSRQREANRRYAEKLAKAREDATSSRSETLEEKKARVRAGHHKPSLYNVLKASQGKYPWEARPTSPADVAAEQHAMHLGLYTP